MRPMFLPEVEQNHPGGAYARVIEGCAPRDSRSAIMHLLPQAGPADFLSRFTQA